MKKNRDYFWIPFNIALIVGLLVGSTNDFIHAFPTTDWAVKGQPFIERWINRQEWFLSGFIPGALIGAVVGMVWYKFRRK